MLGRTLIHDPQVLVLYEPAAGLDPRALVELRDLIHLPATEMNKTVFISSHILTELGEICDSAAIIQAGRILASGTINEIRDMQRESRGGSGAETFIARVANRVDDLERWLLEQPYVGLVSASGDACSFEFEGEQVQQHKILKGIIENGFELLEFHGKTESLEDAFMAITKGITQ